MGADCRGPLDRHMRKQAASFSQFDVWPNHAIWTNLAAVMKFSAGINNGRGMDFHLPPTMAPRFPLFPARISFQRVIDRRACSSPGLRQRACSLHAPWVAAPDPHVDFNAQLIAWNHRATELGSLNSGEQDQFALAILHLGE
jgi:hypothetical protein